MTWDDLVAEAQALGYAVELVDYCEGPDSPGLLGQGLGVCIYGKRVIRIREALRPEDRAWILAHEIDHARIAVDGGDRVAQRALDDAHYADPEVVAAKLRINEYLYPTPPEDA